MRVFAIGDLHLPGGQRKPMDVFGAHWEGHFDKICADWRKKVEDEDVVLLPGDISWAMTLEEAAPDLAAVCALPGRKIFLRGNHDYWWSSLTRLRALLRLMSCVEDTNLLARRGPEQAAWVRKQAIALANRFSLDSVRRLDAEMTRRGLSPGGCADLLAVTIFLDALERAEQ